MKTPFVVKSLLIAFIALGMLQPSFAQNDGYVKPITAADSVLLKRYLDTVNNTPFFSQKRLRYFDSALSICPWKAYWWQQKGMVLMKQKKYEAGMDNLDSAVKYDARAYIDYRAFMKCIFQKSYRGAIKDFEASKTIIGAGEVMDHTYDFYIGLCYLMLNRHDSAEYYFTKTTNEQQKSMGSHYVHPLDWFYLGITYYEQEDYAKAIEIFDNCLNLYKNFSDAEYYKAICLWRLHKNDEALAVMKEAESDFKQGYTINEDNAIHENYPYQVYKPAYYTNMLKTLETAN